MTQGGQLDQLYFDLTHALAQMIYSRCVTMDGRHALYEHFNENRLGIPPEILARLGIMCGRNPNEVMISGSHAFQDDWTPERPLTLKRHAGEPGIFDLIVAVCLKADWDGRPRRGFGKIALPLTDTPPPLDLSDHRRFGSGFQLAFQWFFAAQGSLLPGTPRPGSVG